MPVHGSFLPALVVEEATLANGKRTEELKRFAQKSKHPFPELSPDTSQAQFGSLKRKQPPTQNRKLSMPDSSDVT